jgi:hypothetical protein
VNPPPNSESHLVFSYGRLLIGIGMLAKDFDKQINWQGEGHCDLSRYKREGIPGMYFFFIITSSTHLQEAKPSFSTIFKMHFQQSSLSLGLTSLLATGALAIPLAGEPAPKVPCSVEPPSQPVTGADGSVSGRVSFNINAGAKILQVITPVIAVAGTAEKVITGHLLIAATKPVDILFNKFKHNRWCHVSPDSASYICDIPFDQLPGGEGAICSSSVTNPYFLAQHLQLSSLGDLWTGADTIAGAAKYLNFTIACSAPNNTPGVSPPPPSPTAWCSQNDVAWLGAPVGVAANIITSTIPGMLTSILGLMNQVPADCLTSGNISPLYQAKSILGGLVTTGVNAATLVGNVVYRVEEGILKAGVIPIPGYALTNVAVSTQCVSSNGIVAFFQSLQFQLAVALTNAPSCEADASIQTSGCSMENLRVIVKAKVAKAAINGKCS